MKHIFLLIFFLPLFSISQKLNLKGNINGLKDGTQIVLADLENPGSSLAETKSKTGAFELSTRLEAPTLLGFIVADSLKTAVFLGNENVNITGSTDQKIDDWTFTGSKIQNDFTKFQQEFTPKFANLNQLAQTLQMSGNQEAKSTLETAVADIQRSVDEFIAANPASPVSTLAILSTISLTDDVALLEKRTNSLKPEALSNVLGGHLKQAIIDAKFNAVGSMALDFSQQDMRGKMISLSDFKGKYVLVDFWASWCGPCRRENVNLVKTYNKFKNKNFTVFGVSLDENTEKWSNAIKKDSLTWTHVSDLKGWDNEVARKYKIMSIPRNFLVGPDGKILAKDLRGEELDMKLAELLNK